VPLAEIFLLALASMVWPTLIGVVVVALASPRPVALLSFFLAGSLLTTVGVGLVVVFVLRGSSLFSGSRPTFGPIVDLAVGVVALLVAYLVGRGRPARQNSSAKPDRPGWTERTLSRGAPIAFVVGIVLNVIPGVLPLVALKDIAELDYSVGASVALVVGFYLIMFLPAEVPLGAFLFAPAPTSAAVGRFNSWLRRNARHIGVLVLALAGIYLLVRGIVLLVAGGT
jgi:Sap-like sulfolipid-1-addressing protein